MRPLQRLMPVVLALFSLSWCAGKPASANDSVAAPTTANPEATYHQAWQLVQERFVDEHFGGQDWSKWEHRFDGQLTTMPEAHTAIQQMLASLHDKYTRILRPLAEAPSGLVASCAGESDDTLTVRQLSNAVGYIKIPSFTSANCISEMSAALDKTAAQSTLILDLRGNRGGQVRNALSIADMFLKDGTIVTTSGRDGNRTYTASGNARSNQKLVLLVDGGSASATEILCGALMDNHRATVIGERTFGKGLVQEVIPVGGGAEMRVTVAHYLTPAGNDINGKGLQPDIAVAADEDALVCALRNLPAI